MVLGLTSDIKVKINSEKDCIKTISVEMASAIVQEKIEKAFESIRTQAKLPGFRPGKAPMEQIRDSYKEVAYERAQESLLQQGVGEALKTKKIQAVQPPIVQNIQFAPQKTFHFEFQVEVAPEFKPANYKGIKINKDNSPVNDQDVSKAMESIAQMNSRLVESQAESLSSTHFAVVNYEGFLNGSPIDGAKADNFLLDMSAPQAIAGLAEGLAGVKPGEEKEISVKFPEDSPSKELAGKDAVFKVKLTAIKEKKVPNIDDEFAKDVGMESLEALRAKVKENLQKERESKNRADVEKQIIEKLLSENSFIVPPSLVKQQAERLIGNQKQRMTEQGYGKEDADKVIDRIKADVHKEAERQVRLAYILDAIADQEDIKVAEDEIAVKITTILNQSQPKERPGLEKALNGTYRDRIRSEIREEKLFSWILSQAKIKEVTAAS